MEPRSWKWMVMDIKDNNLLAKIIGQKSDNIFMTVSDHLNDVTYLVGFYDI